MTPAFRQPLYVSETGSRARNVNSRKYSVKTHQTYIDVRRHIYDTYSQIYDRTVSTFLANGCGTLNIFQITSNANIFKNNVEFVLENVCK